MRIVNYRRDPDVPRFIDVLIDIDNCRTHKGKTIDMWSEYCTFLVHANAIQRTFSHLLTRPLLKCVAGGIPDVLSQSISTMLESRIFYVHHVALPFPMIDYETKNKPGEHS
jgi:hypothetical protein